MHWSSLISHSTLAIQHLKRILPSPAWFQTHSFLDRAGSWGCSLPPITALFTFDQLNALPRCKLRRSMHFVMMNRWCYCVFSWSFSAIPKLDEWAILSETFACTHRHPLGLAFTRWGCYGLRWRHKSTGLAHTFFILFLCLFLSYGPFNCISFHKPSRQLSIFSLCSSGLLSASLVLSTTSQWGAADAEIKVPSGENRA